MQGADQYANARWGTPINAISRGEVTAKSSILNILQINHLESQVCNPGPSLTLLVTIL